MPSLKQLLCVAPALLAVAYSQGVILSAQGTKGSVASLPLQVSLTQSDANIINSQEIAENAVNECGRTLLAGNIDIGENTEDQLLNKTVTSVTKGSTVSVTLNQVNADGAGPYTCDLDPTGNADGTSGQLNLTMTEKDAGDGTTTLTLTMPSDLACIGSSAGNVCTVRCFNTAAAGPFGGCFAVQQTDTTASVNQAATITTAQTLEGIQAQIEVNQKDLGAAIKANAEAATTSEQGVDAVNEILSIDSTASATAGAAEATSAANAKAAGSTTSATSAKASKAAAAAAAKAKGAKDGNGKNGRRGARVFIS
ncbi:uncharacterized protein LY89DRAFT_577416 [Mollisia scopiformis]|uniref:GEgh 16 protein n=1 Tax=Mollisia scopiformis TaxID=149040 RepID=A0A194XMX6_MOLSC|nr:uncharacterized protein LY89DRAFT_577416 [Mollisia scopiformis]KUJ21439.1 hypothetical protein LY89DRAFT_577416 [Mollisia scopiformis]